MQDQNFIDNEWRPARSGATDDILNPATGAVIGTAPASDAADVDDAVAAAGAGLPGVGGQDPAGAQRGASTSWPAASRRDIENLSAIESENVGKPVSIMEFEMDLTLDNWRFFASAGRFLEGRAAGEYMDGLHLDAAAGAARRRRVDRAVELPAQHGHLEGRRRRWPSATPSCSSRRSSRPYTALRLAELAADVLPPGVLNVVCGQGETAGVALVAHPDVAMVSLTGSVAAGKAIAKAVVGDAQARAPRARRQGAGRRVRRRRPRRRRRRRARRRLLQLRARTAPPPAA